jgi:hypothetical protein
MKAVRNKIIFSILSFFFVFSLFINQSFAVSTGIVTYDYGGPIMQTVLCCNGIMFTVMDKRTSMISTHMMPWRAMATKLKAAYLLLPERNVVGKSIRGGVCAQIWAECATTPTEYQFTATDPYSKVGVSGK